MKCMGFDFFKILCYIFLVLGMIISPYARMIALFFYNTEYY